MSLVQQQLAASTRLTIEFVTAEDFDQWLPLWRAYQVFYKVSLSEEVTKKTWERFLDPSMPVHCLVARLHHDNNTSSSAAAHRIVGFAHFVFHASTWSTDDYCYLEDLFVDPECRGQQVGKRLITRLYWEAMGLVFEQQGGEEEGKSVSQRPDVTDCLPTEKRMRVEKSSRVYWHTQETNFTAQRLYNWVAKKTEFIQYCKPRN